MRGITVCGEWLESFEAFWRDMEAGYSASLTLGRVNNNLGYCKENCRWETDTEQSNNKRSNVFIQTPAGRMTISQAARHYGMKPITLHARLTRYGMTVSEALSKPVSLSSTSRIVALDPGL